MVKFLWKIPKNAAGFPGYEEVSRSKELMSRHIKINGLQRFEIRIVIPVVVGSSPTSHPKEFAAN
jgi:hypothetical protein